MVVAGILNKELKQVNSRWEILGFFLIFFLNQQEIVPEIVLEPL